MSRPDLGVYDQNQGKLYNTKPLLPFALAAGFAVAGIRYYQWRKLKSSGLAKKIGGLQFVLESRIFIQTTLVCSFMGALWYYDDTRKERSERLKAERLQRKEAARLVALEIDSTAPTTDVTSKSTTSES